MFALQSYVSELLPFGSSTNAGLSKKLIKGDDVISNAIICKVGFPAMISKGTVWKRIWIHTDGFLIIKQDGFKINKLPKKDIGEQDEVIIAPFWADAVTSKRFPSSAVFYDVYEMWPLKRIRTEEERLFLNHISKRLNISTFQATWALVVTWRDLRPGDILNPSEKNTFQAVLVTDGRASYVIYLYERMEWKTFNLLYRDVVVGYRRGIDDSNYFMTSIRNTDILQIDKIKGNTGIYGWWQFPLGVIKEKENFAQQCMKWYYENSAQQRIEARKLSALSTPCPCNLLQAKKDTRFEMYQNSNNCLRLMFPTDGKSKGVRICCYDYQTNALKPTDSPFFINDPTNAKIKWIEEDKKPVDVCCSFSAYCSLFNEVRSVSDCSNYVMPVEGGAFGDPHIQTIDGKFYTFNGWGEFTLLNIYHKDKPKDRLFTLEGRTERGENVHGELTDATIFTAFVAMDFVYNNSFQVEIMQNKEGIIIIANGIDFTVQFVNDENFNQSMKFMKLKKLKNGGIQGIFQKGLTLNINQANGILDIGVAYPPEMRSVMLTRGLLGVVDGNPDNDFQAPDGSVLPSNATEKDIYNRFGLLWKAQKPCFTYAAGKNSSSYKHANFTPRFINKEELLSLSDNEAKRFCRNNIECLYDLWTTNIKQLAENTKIVKQTAEANTEFRENSPPQIKSKRVMYASVGLSSRLNFTVIDDDNTQAFLAKPSKSLEIYHDNQTNKGYVIYTPASTEPVSIQIVVKDSKNAVAPIQEIQVVLCPGCKHGKCDFQNNAQELFHIVACDCDIGYTGEDCNVDYDGCASSPCLGEAQCIDVPAELQTSNGLTYRCNCSDGYSLYNDKCVDVDECDRGKSKCQQICINTLGSYQCACKSGYQLSNDVNCYDVDECRSPDNGCQQTCENIEGSYQCGCSEGYKLAKDQKSCEKVVDYCTEHNLTNCYGCKFEDGQIKCFCPAGYELGHNNFSCVDIDECASPVHRCSQICQNKPGGFTCHCYPGYKLKPDKVICEKCDIFHWGENCKNKCACNGNEELCDSIRGCVCKKGWTGIHCDQDINECAGNHTCYDFENMKCINTQGSYHCICQNGYIDDSEGHCIDINECKTGVHFCSQKCRDVEGTYNCECYDGYRLNDDRRTCTKMSENELCNAVNCSHICLVESTRPVCYCQKGFRLAKDKITCLYVDPCKTANCSQYCQAGNDGNFKCSCDPGFKLDQTGLICTKCDGYHYGEDCEYSCDCKMGSCHYVYGCSCDPGWSGDKCDQNIDECSIGEYVCNAGQTCQDTLGNYTCVCGKGYWNNNGTCQNIDECKDGSLNSCSQTCTDTEGSFECGCHNGFTKINDTCIELKYQFTSIDFSILIPCPRLPFLNKGYQQYLQSAQLLKSIRFSYSQRTNFSRNQNDMKEEDQYCQQAVNITEQFDAEKEKPSKSGQKCLRQPILIFSSHVKDIDECKPEANNCNQICRNNQGSYECFCERFYSRLPDGKTCIQVALEITMDLVGNVTDLEQIQSQLDILSKRISTASFWKIESTERRYKILHTKQIIQFHQQVQEFQVAQLKVILLDIYHKGLLQTNATILVNNGPSFRNIDGIEGRCLSAVRSCELNKAVHTVHNGKGKRQSASISGRIDNMHQVWILDIRISQSNLHCMIPQLQFPPSIQCKEKDCSLPKTLSKEYR
ncbi:mucin-like protein [Octopus bimaculoides]|uniref:mucin-like protein n=1 Tax=Octopus bimaculoides TaxID=37653 RepID=UPI0022E8C3FB|nr:mucin-like protein [Octopus bimaculoides]